MRIVDFVLIAAVLAFVVLATLEFSRSVSGAERGLLLFEKTCPIYNTNAGHPPPRKPISS